MKRKQLLAALCVIGATGGGNFLHAQTAVPFLNEKNDFGGTPVSSLSTFVPSVTTYTLELTGCVAETEITVPGGSFSYTPTTGGTVRFVRNGGDVVYVYEGTIYKGTVSVTTPAAPTYPTGLTSASTENLIRNGGFEDTSAGTYGSYSNRWNPTYWKPYTSNKTASGEGSTVRDGSKITGTYAMLMHDYGDGFYLTQQLTSNSMKNFTPYQISYKYKANADNQKGAKYRFQVGSEEFKTDYFSSNETNATTTSIQTFTQTFVSPATIVNQPYVQLYRSADTNAQNLDYVDEFILVAANGGGIGITNATGATFLSGSAYAPIGGFASATSYSLESTYNTSLVTNGTFDSNANGWTTTTNASNKGVASNKAGAFTGNFWENWNGSPYTGKMYQTVSDIPNGTYKLNICSFVNTVDADKGQYVYANTNKTYVYTTTPTAYTVYTYVTDNTLEYGLSQTTAVTNWMGIDNVSLEYCGASDVTVAGFQSLYEAAPNHLDDNNYSNVTGTEKTNLQTAVTENANPEETADGYATATFNISYADDVFTTAKSSYDAFDVEKDRAIAIGVSPASIVRPTSADNLQDALNALYVLEDVSTTTGYTVDATDIFGAWIPQNTGSASGQHWSGDDRSYIDKNDTKGYTMSVTNTVTLPAGKYVFKAAARAANGGVNGAFNMNVTVGSNATVYEDYSAQGDTGKGIDTSGAANYGEGTFANNGNGRGWEWRFIGFELTEETSVTMQVYAQILANKWVSFSDITLWTTTDNVEICRQMWAASKAAAESARDNGTYTNVGGEERKDLTDAIDASVTETIEWYTNQKEILDDATATFIAAPTVAAYDRLAAALATATTISFVATDYEATPTTTAEGALSNANALYTAMLEEQKTTKGGRVLGFEVGEYAPYNNVEVVTALNAANAIDNDNVATTASATLDTAIKNLNDASWSEANVTEVNAFYDGTFNSYAAQETSADNTKLKGWTSGNNFRQILKTKETFPGLEYATDGTAIFSWSSGGSYGSETGYTMPLKENAYYILEFKAAGWNNETKGNITVSVLNGEDGLDATNMGRADKDIKGNTNNAAGLTSFIKVFKTGAAGDYIFSIRSTNNIVFTDVSITKCPTVEANMKITGAHYATFIAPFDVEIPNDVTAWTVDNTDAQTTILTLNEVTSTISANTPVVLYSENEVDKNVSGQNIATEDTYTEGALTGVYVDTPAPVGSYVLQKNDDKVGFYPVETGYQPTVGANRAYLTDSTVGGAKPRAFFFNGDDATGIDAIGALTSGQYDAIYTSNGVQVPALQKGLNIVVKGNKTYKIFVK